MEVTVCGVVGTGSFTERVGRVEVELGVSVDHKGKTIAERVAQCEHEAGIGKLWPSQGSKHIRALVARQSRPFTFVVRDARQSPNCRVGTCCLDYRSDHQHQKSAATDASAGAHANRAAAEVAEAERQRAAFATWQRETAKGEERQQQQQQRSEQRATEVRGRLCKPVARACDPLIDTTSFVPL